MTRELDVEGAVRDAHENVQPRSDAWTELQERLGDGEESPSRRAWVPVAVAAALYLTVLGIVALERGARSPDGEQQVAARSFFEGNWDLALTREGMVPKVSNGLLVLRQSGRTWSGTLAFGTILYGKRHELSDIEIKGKRVSFSIVHEQFELEFRGKRIKSAITGMCNWKRLGSYPFTAEPSEELLRFEKGLKFDRDFVAGDPTGANIDSSVLDMLIKTGKSTKSDALLVVKDGKVLCERYYGGRDTQIHLMSVTKCLTATAVALLVDEGKIAGLDAPLSTWFEDWREGRKAKVTLRHLLSHTSGIRHGKTAADLNAAHDKVAYVRALELEADPGTRFSYNNEAVALLSGVVKAASGRRLEDYVAQKIFKPLGIKKWTWDRDGAGNTITYAQLALRARDLARVGMMMANDGRWRGRQVMPKALVRTLVEPTTRLSERVGLLWWIEGSKPKAYYHTGWLGQWLVVIPEENIVGVRLRRNSGVDDASLEFGGFLQTLTRLKRTGSR